VNLGGIGRLAELLGRSRVWLQRLMRSGLVPTTEEYKGLAWVSGKTTKEVQHIFGGPRIGDQTKVFLAKVRARFSNDVARIAVADLITHEYGSLSAFVAAADGGLHREPLRRWLIGESKYLARKARAAIERLAHLPRRIVAHLSRQAEKGYRTRALARERKLRRRKGPRHKWPEDKRQKISENKKALWARKGWRQEKGVRVVDAMLDGLRIFQKDEEKYLTSVIRRVIGQFQWAGGRRRRKYPRAATQNDIPSVLCRIWSTHHLQFHGSSPRIEDLPQKVEETMGAPLHSVLRANGRPFNVKEVCALLELALANGRSKPFLQEASLRLYGTDDRIERIAKLWSRIKAIPIPFDTLLRLASAALGRAVAPSQLQDVLERPAGRPTKPDPTPA